MWPEHKEPDGFLWPGSAKITSCGISGPAGPLQQETIKNIHTESCWNSPVFLLRWGEGSSWANGFGWNVKQKRRRTGMFCSGKSLDQNRWRTKTQFTEALLMERGNFFVDLMNNVGIPPNKSCDLSHPVNVKGQIPDSVMFNRVISWLFFPSVVALCSCWLLFFSSSCNFSASTHKFSHR